MLKYVAVALLATALNATTAAAESTITIEQTDRAIVVDDTRQHIGDLVVKDAVGDGAETVINETVFRLDHYPLGLDVELDGVPANVIETPSEILLAFQHRIHIQDGIVARIPITARMSGTIATPWQFNLRIGSNNVSLSPISAGITPFHDEKQYIFEFVPERMTVTTPNIFEAKIPGEIEIEIADQFGNLSGEFSINIDIEDGKRDISSGLGYFSLSEGIGIYPLTFKEGDREDYHLLVNAVSLDDPNVTFSSRISVKSRTTAEGTFPEVVSDAISGAGDFSVGCSVASVHGKGAAGLALLAMGILALTTLGRRLKGEL